MIALARHLPGAPADMIALIEAWDSVRPQLEALAGAAPDHKLTDVTLHAPLTRLDKIIGIGLNYADHAAEANMVQQEEQLCFSKQATCIADPYGPIQLPKLSDKLDYKAEPVFVIVKPIRDVSPPQTPDPILRL